MLVMAVAHVSGTVDVGAWGDEFFGRWGYNVMYLCVGVCVIIGGLTSQERRAGWLFIGGSILVWTVGNLYYTAFLWDAAVMPGLSISDVCWLAFYPGCLVGLVLIFRGEVGYKGHGFWVDGLTAALTVAAFVAALVFEPIITAAGERHIYLLLAFPVGDMILLALVVAAVASVGWTGARG